MKLDELEKLLVEHDEFCKKHGAPEIFAGSFVVIRPRPPTGLKIRTPFGLCVILNCKKTEGGNYQTCFAVTRRQLVALINKLSPLLLQLFNRECAA